MIKILRCKFKKGFSLIEVLIVTGILGIVSVAILATFSSGIAVYGRIQTFGHKQIDLLLALERMDKDIKNTFFLGEVPFEGSSTELSFPGINLTYDNKGNELTGLGRISYQFNDSNKTLEVKWRAYNSGYPEDISGKDSEEKLANVEDVQFKYFSCGDTGADGEWVDEWTDKTRLPRGVEIKITSVDGDQTINLDRKIFIPASIRVKDDEKDDTGEASPEA